MAKLKERYSFIVVKDVKGKGEGMIMKINHLNVVFSAEPTVLILIVSCGTSPLTVQCSVTLISSGIHSCNPRGFVD